jgi:hypothetical protein
MTTESKKLVGNWNMPSRRAVSCPSHFVAGCIWTVEDCSLPTLGSDSSLCAGTGIENGCGASEEGIAWVSLSSMGNLQ